MTTRINGKKAEFALEVWKKTIEVQEHFNTIEMQIRNFAITIMTATVGAASLVYNQLQENIREALKANQPIPSANTIYALGLNLSSADMIIVAGMLGWFAFYVMDRWWYHKFLYGAVKHAEGIENKIKDTQYGDLMSLTNAISEASHFKFLGINIESNTRINLFYGFGLLLQTILILLVF